MAEGKLNDLPPCSVTPAAFILEQARQKYPENLFFIVSHSKDRTIEIATNFDPGDHLRLLEDLRDMITNGPLYEKPIPKI